VTKFVVYRNPYRGTGQAPFEARDGLIDGTTIERCLTRRAIEACTSWNILTESEKEVTSRAVLQDIHTQVRAALTRIDASLSEIHARERSLTDGTFRAKVVAETRASFDAHAEEAQGIVELFAPQTTA
jgi:hypothetical protein